MYKVTWQHRNGEWYHKYMTSYDRARKMYLILSSCPSIKYSSISRSGALLMHWPVARFFKHAYEILS